MERQTAQTAAEPRADRPTMPPDYGLPADREGLLPWSYVTERMERSRNYWICTTRPDGRPHAMPVWGVWVDGAFYFGAGPQSVKGRNLAANPAVVVHLESGDEAVILEGEAVPVVNMDRTLFDRTADAYEQKYGGFRPEYPEVPGGTFTVRPRVAFGWLEQDFVRSATRWRFDR